MKTTSISGVASIITLELTETLVYLQDYIVDTSSIVSISAPEGIDVWENKRANTITLEIVNNSIVPKISTLDITYANGTIESIILQKSKKITYTVYYHQAAHSVQIAGDFNSWNPKGFDLHFINNCWQIDLEIESGNYSYQLIVNGNWINDPGNPEVVEDGYGGYNSLLRVPFTLLEKEIHLQTSEFSQNSITITSNIEDVTYLVMWNNLNITFSHTFHSHLQTNIRIPKSAFERERSYIRVYAFDSFGTANDLLIPLEKGRVVSSSKTLNRQDKEAQVIYFILVDRFCQCEDSSNNIQPNPEIHPKSNFYGGNICGITKKIKEGYFKELGVNTLWISPIVKNPNVAIYKHSIASSSYHGYWPIESKKIDEHFGTEKEFKNLVETAHKHGINILLDYVANHVYKDNEIIVKNPNWSTPLYLPDGTKNIGRWEDQRFTTWFDDFLPTLNYDLPEVVDEMTDIALEWVQKYKLDGFRHDATKHIQTNFWRTLTKKIKQSYALPNNVNFYQIGETFGGREMLQSYVSSGIHDGQFSFNLYYEVRSAFLYEQVHFDKLTTCLKQELQSFGYNHKMGNISGNHDLPRFISYAGEDLWTNQNAEHEGWNRHITVKNPIGYKKLCMLHAFIHTVPGIPVIYYGDEIGIPGGGDPDNRRPMKFQALSAFELETRKHVSKLVDFRTHYLPFIYGSFEFVEISKQVLVYKRKYFEQFAYVIFNKTNNTQKITIKHTNTISKNLLSLQGNSVIYKNATIEVEIPSMTYEILYSHNF